LGIHPDDAVDILYLFQSARKNEAPSLVRFFHRDLMVYRVKYLRNIIDGIAYSVFQGCSLLDPIQHVFKNGHEILAVPETGLRHGVEVPMEDVEIRNAKKGYGV
jgi:hypothetical protein